LDLFAFKENILARLEGKNQQETALNDQLLKELGDRLNAVEGKLSDGLYGNITGRIDLLEKGFKETENNKVSSDELTNLGLRVKAIEVHMGELSELQKHNEVPSDNTQNQAAEAVIGELQQLKANYMDVISLIQKIQGSLVNGEKIESLEKTASDALNSLHEYGSTISNHDTILKAQGEDLIKIGKYNDILKQQMTKIVEKIDEIEGNLHIFKVENPTEVNPFKDLEPAVKAETPLAAKNSGEVKPTTMERVSDSRANEDISSVYDVRIIEEILHSSRDAGAREEKNRIVGLWPTLSDKVSGNLISIAKLLMDGVIAAVGDQKMIIAYPNATVCNHIMRPKNHGDAKTVLKTVLGKDYDFIALPENTWQEKRSEYRGQYNMGVRYPKLSPIQNSELKSLNLDNDNFTFSPNKSIQKAEELFGKKLVKVED
jgi:hypothetical protein